MQDAHQVTQKNFFVTDWNDTFAKQWITVAGLYKTLHNTVVHLMIEKVTDHNTFGTRAGLWPCCGNANQNSLKGTFTPGKVPGLSDENLAKLQLPASVQPIH